MSKSKIEWCDYTLNPIKGLCPVGCSYCYARAMYRRFKWNPEIRMEPDWQGELPKKPVKIFVGSTMELFGDWVEDWMWESIWQYVNGYPQHTFIFLTKRPKNLLRWSPFPENCWVGASASDYYQMFKATRWLPEIKASIKFISFEPLLENMIGPRFNLRDISWVIIGAQTPYSAKTAPRIEWIVDIVEAADKAGIPVFLKNNLTTSVIEGATPFYKRRPPDMMELRQEVPDRAR